MYNLHTHTNRCKHAEGKIIDYAEFANKNNIDILGISDHCPFPDGRWDMHRMNINELPEYIKDIKEVKSIYKNINFITGLEVEWVEDFKNFYDEIINKYKIEYFIGSVHYFKTKNDKFTWKDINTHDRLKIYTEELLKTMESGIMNFIAHPDAFGFTYKKWDKEAEKTAISICKKAIELDLILELNSSGYRKPESNINGILNPVFPIKEFWEIASDLNVKVIVNSDAHKPEDLLSHYDDCKDILDEIKLNIIEPEDLIKTFRVF